MTPLPRPVRFLPDPDPAWFDDPDLAISLESLRFFVLDIPKLQAWGQEKAARDAKALATKSKPRGGNVTTRKPKPTMFGHE